jgi:hypothetical protein
LMQLIFELDGLSRCFDIKHHIVATGRNR